jgi:hypothetical protein
MRTAHLPTAYHLHYGCPEVILCNGQTHSSIAARHLAQS